MARPLGTGRACRGGGAHVSAESTVDDEVLQKSFRSAMGNVAAAVSVVTTFADGEPLGSTVSAFASLSMEPPMLLVSL
ncbi:MAG: hypothetical protein QOH68_938, partial [Nocardioidaceae bacterium]|nr:hypothetical protein [Nocardioidaceae bacterium]